ncbi:MAG: hypothetical protein JSS53_05495 [Proteobacteria bacterium]|nr:hypothetical protein [Pseudomonadota bacterium]
MNILSTLPVSAKQKLLVCLQQDNFKAAKEIYDAWLIRISKHDIDLVDSDFDEDENLFSER